VLDQILIALLWVALPDYRLPVGEDADGEDMAQTLGLSFKRIQFTPDLMPSDITGTDIIEEDLTTGHRKWTFVEGRSSATWCWRTRSIALRRRRRRRCWRRCRSGVARCAHIYKLPAPFFVLRRRID